MDRDSFEEDTRHAIEKLTQMIESDDIVIFNRSEATALREVAGWWIALRGAGRLGAALASGVKWAAFMIAAGIAFKAGLLEWLTSNLLGGPK